MLSIPLKNGLDKVIKTPFLKFKKFFKYPIFNQRQRFDCKGYFKLIIVKW